MNMQFSKPATKPEEKKPDWRAIDPDDFDTETAIALAEYKSHAEKAKKARKKLEELVTYGVGDLEDGQELKFAYVYAPSYAIVEKDPTKEKKPAKPKLSLAEWKAQQAASGYRS